jgi:hypothetical protein
VRISSSKLKVVFKFNTTAHEVRQRARCHNCGVKCNNTYQIVYPGNSDVAMDGAGVRLAVRGASGGHIRPPASCYVWP